MGWLREVSHQLSLLAGGRDRASASGLLEACKTHVCHLGGGSKVLHPPVMGVLI